jgi:hypothetical protein
MYETRTELVAPCGRQAVRDTARIEQAVQLRSMIDRAGSGLRQVALRLCLESHRDLLGTG